MSSLVLEVQAAAMDKTVLMSELLLKAKALSVKLDAPEIKEWIEFEAHGYPSSVDIPAYRMITGRPMFFNPYNGWCPIHARYSRVQEMISTAAIRDGVGSIEISANSSQSSRVSYTPELRNMIDEEVDLMGMEPSIKLSGGSLVGILDKVRSIVLDWALDLEAQGVTGEGMTFSVEDKERAIMVNNNITNNIGVMNNSQLQQATDNSAQAQSNTDIDYDRVSWIIDKVTENVEQLGIEDDEVIVELNGELDTVRENLRTPKPDIEIIAPALRSAKNILEGVAGSVLATEYANEIATVLNSLSEAV